MASYGIEFELSSGVMKDDDMADVTVSKTKARSKRRNWKRVHEGVAGAWKRRAELLANFYDKAKAW